MCPSRHPRRHPRREHRSTSPAQDSVHQPHPSSRQTTLFEYAWLVTVRYSPLPDRCRELPPWKRRGLSEREIRRKLERQGWKVWRGELIGILRTERSREEGLYPVVRRKYALLRSLMEKRHPGKHEFLEYLSAVHHGMPDFLCHHPTWGFRFVECKLGHEQLRDGQKRSIRRLQLLGFDVEIWTLVEERTKRRAAVLDVESGRAEIRERQLAFTRRRAKITG